MATHSEKAKHLVEVMKDFDAGMLVTRTSAGVLRGRPMAIAKVDDDGAVYLSTSLDSPKVQELESDPRVTLQLQGKAQFVSVSGTATLRKDRALVDSLWKESWKVWFPKGKDDPSLAIIVVKPEEGEYWDNYGASGLALLVEAAKAYVTGQKPKVGEDTNAKVSL
jgi:general stress protein 26